MGCCASRPAVCVLDVPRSLSTTDTYALRQSGLPGGCQLHTYTSSCPASFPFTALTRVVVGEGHLFAALWEGQGGPQAARLCAASCYETLMQALSSSPDPAAALRQTTQALDKAWFAADLPDTVKASVGATGVMLLLDTRSARCHVARLGDARPFVTSSSGSFNTTRVDVKRLSSDQSHRVALSELASSSSSSSGTPMRHGTPGRAYASEPGPAAAAYQPGDAAPGPVASYARAVGLGYGKSARLRQVWLQQQPKDWPLRDSLRRDHFISSECEVSSVQLGEADESLVLAGEGLLRVVPAQQAGLLLHFFHAGKLNSLKATYASMAAMQAASAGCAQPGQPQQPDGRARGVVQQQARQQQPQQPQQQRPPPVQMQQPNVASILMHQALAKALDRHNARAASQHDALLADLQEARAGSRPGSRAGGRPGGLAAQIAELQELGPLELSYEEHTALPLALDQHALRLERRVPEDAALVPPPGYCDGGPSKADVHGDMAVVVISLDWPKPAGVEGGTSQLSARAARGGPSRPGAQFRWQLLRLAVKAAAAYRRALREAWWHAVAGAQGAAKAAAREAEVHAWKVLGAAVKVSPLGDVRDPRLDSPASRAGARASPAKPWSTPGSLGSPAPPARRALLKPGTSTPASAASLRGSPAKPPPGKPLGEARLHASQQQAVGTTPVLAAASPGRSAGLSLRSNRAAAQQPGSGSAATPGSSCAGAGVKPRRLLLTPGPEQGPEEAAAVSDVPDSPSGRQAPDSPRKAAALSLASASKAQSLSLRGGSRSAAKPAATAAARAASPAPGALALAGPESSNKAGGACPAAAAPGASGSKPYSLRAARKPAAHA